MQRVAVLAITLGLLAGACSSQLGRSIIECDIDISQPNATTIISAQAIPSADYLPCVEALRPGWDYNHVEPESGRVWFALDSDRLGERFVQVTMTRSCDVGAAMPLVSDQDGAAFYVDLIEDRTEAMLTIIPIAARHREYAFSVSAELEGRSIDGHRVDPSVDDGDAPASSRIAQAIDSGSPVLIVDDQEVDDGTVSIRERDGDEESGLLIDDVVDELEGTFGDPAYRAAWFYVFDGSCIRYDIDAEGPGAERAERDIKAALGFYDLTELKDLARREGYGGLE